LPRGNGRPRKQEWSTWNIPAAQTARSTAASQLLLSYSLTNIRAAGLKPSDVRRWADDLWVFPYYVDRKFVPYDARKDGPASTAWPDLSVRSDSSDTIPPSGMISATAGTMWVALATAGGAAAAALAAKRSRKGL